MSSEAQKNKNRLLQQFIKFPRTTLHSAGSCWTGKRGEWQQYHSFVCLCH